MMLYYNIIELVITTVVNNKYWENEAQIVKWESMKFSGIFANTTHSGTNTELNSNGHDNVEVNRKNVLFIVFVLKPNVIMCY